MSTSTRIVCIGFNESDLTADQKAKLSAYSDEAKPIEIRVYPSLDCTSDESIPSGFQAIFSPSSLVDATTISDSLFQTLAVSKILDKDLTDKHFEERQAQIASSVIQSTTGGPIPASRNAKNYREIATWEPELGSFIGIYAKADENDHRNKSYYAIGQTSLPLLVQDLKKRIGSDATVTYHDLLHNDKWMNTINYIQNATRRNTYRAIANAAEAAEVTVRRTDDLHAYLADPNHAQPEVATPQYEQVTHGISSIAYEGAPAIMVSYGVVSSEDCLRLHNDQFFVVGDPYSGISLFTLSNHKDIEAATGIPADTGRFVGASAPKKNISGIVWERGGGDLATHLATYKPVDTQFKNALKTMGWNSEHHVEKLIPVIVKINNPTVRK